MFIEIAEEKNTFFRYLKREYNSILFVLKQRINLVLLDLRSLRNNIGLLEFNLNLCKRIDKKKKLIKVNFKFGDHHVKKLRPVFL